MTQTLDQALAAAGIRTMMQRRTGMLVILGGVNTTDAENREHARVTVAVLKQFPEHKQRVMIGAYVTGDPRNPDVIPALYVPRYAEPDPSATDDAVAVEIGPDGATCEPTPGCNCPPCAAKRAEAERKARLN